MYNSVKFQLVKTEQKDTLINKRLVNVRSCGVTKFALSHGANHSSLIDKCRYTEASVSGDEEGVRIQTIDFKITFDYLMPFLTIKANSMISKDSEGSSAFI